MLLCKNKIYITFTNTSCSLERVIPEISKLVANGAEVFPIIHLEEKFLKEEIEKIEEITNKKMVDKLENDKQDLMAVIPCSRRYYC